MIRGARILPSEGPGGNVEMQFDTPTEGGRVTQMVLAMDPWEALRFSQRLGAAALAQIDANANAKVCEAVALFRDRRRRG